MRRLWQGSGILFLPAGQYAKWAWEFPCSSKMPNEPEEKLVSSHSRVKGLLSQPVSVIPIWTVLLWEDVAETLTLLASANPAIHFSYDHSTPSGTYRFDTQEIIQVLEGVPLGHPEILPAIQNLIRENLKEIHADQSMSIRQS